MGHQGAEKYHSCHILLAHACLQKKSQKKIRVFYVYFLRNVISGTNTVSEERHAPKCCPIKLHHISNFYIISYFARTAIDEEMDGDF